MALEYTYKTEEEVPTEHKDLYVEANGTWNLTGINGLKTPQDVANVQEALRKEREDHGKVKKDLKAFDGLGTPDEIHTMQDEFPVLKAQLEGKGGDVEEQVEKLVTTRLAAVKAPLDRQIEKLTEENGDLNKENTGLKGTITLGEKNTILTEAASAAKVLPTAISDILVIAGSQMEFVDGKLVTGEGGPVAAGLDPVAYMAEMPTIKPHWFPPTAGGGAGGGGPGGGFSENPFSNEHWNLTKQGTALKADRSRAEKMAAAAGTKIGAPRPVPKK